MRRSSVHLAVLACLPGLLHAREGMISISDLLAPKEIIGDLAVTAPQGVRHSASSDGNLQLSGELKDNSATIVLRPQQGHWDISRYAYLRVDITNDGDGLVWIRGRLDNKDAQDWKNSSSSQVYILPDERATLAFPFPRPDDANDAPEIFRQVDSIPNGFRRHWNKFNPEQLLGCRLLIRSTSDQLKLADIQVSLAYPYGAEANAQLLELPYLDKFGQVRQLDWPGKLHSAEELAVRAAKEAREAATDLGPESFNRYGGWKDGPQLEATGFFRVEKYRQRWWFVDPEGRLFFSHGANSVGFNQRTPFKGREALFEWLPSEAEYGAAISPESVQFMIANLHRTFSRKWETEAYDRVHTRLRQWGMNTVGAWSDPDLYRNPKTPYTPILHVRVGEDRLVKGIADPFSPEFEKNVGDGLRKIAAYAGSDPWCLGVFIDNELVWYQDFVHQVLAGRPDLPARKAALAYLEEKYGTIEKLNDAWATDYPSWHALDVFPVESAGFEEDLKALKRLIASRYYKVCRDMMRKVLPNHLYLGSRIHKAPPEVYEESVRYADVLSVNRYMPLAVSGLPKGFDKPCLVSEFHFNAPDRGVPGIGLTYVGDQLQRGRAYATYVLDSVLQPNIVGTHWFAYADQSATGKISRGKPAVNGNIGLVDVTDTPYPEITAYSRGVADVMYSLADTGSADTLRVLQDAWTTTPSTATPK